MKPFLGSLWGSERLRWLTVLVYVIGGSAVARSGIILKDSEKMENIIMIYLGVLIIAIGIVLIFLRPYKKN